ncbi:MAG: COR domain-containing protein [Saprospiraceae bacterium]
MDIPKAVKKLIAKEKREKSGYLNLFDQKINKLPISIMELYHLENLNLPFNKISDLNYLSGFRNLKQLNLYSNNITDISYLKNLTTLRHLDISNNGDIIDVSYLENLKKLQSLHLSNTNVKDFRFLQNLPNLLNLDLSNIEIKDYSFLKKLTKLKSLSLRNNHIPNLSFLESLSNLEIIDMQNSTLQNADSLAKLTHLKNLNLNNTQLKDFYFLENLTELESLKVMNNQIKDISFLENLIGLKKLILDNNQISDLSPLLPLIKKRKLEIVKKGYSKIGQITLEDNPIETPPLEVVKQGNTAILKYFEELEAQGTIELYEAKMLIIGQGGVGKTSLAKKLMNNEAELPEEEDTTKGIEIQEYHFQTKDKKDFRINIWDFGGQEIYHATHQFFLTKRSLYVLVDDTRQDDKSSNDAAFNYWLETVELFGGDSPIIIVQNEKGNRSKALDLKNIQSRFSNVKGSYATNLLDGRGLPKTQTALEHFIQELPIVGQKLPKQWVEIRNALEAIEKKGKHYLTLEEYMSICAEHKIPEEDRALLLSQYLHDLGVFLHFQEDDLLRKIVVLQNEWATDAVYKVLDCESVKQAKGRFSREDLKTIWGDDDCREKYKNMHGELLALMRNFELCYELESEKNTFLAPQLFPEEQPDYNWDEKDSLILRYEYGFMPKGILSRFIVRMHRYVKDLATAWKNGVVLTNGKTQAEVVNLYAEKVIQIRVKGLESKAFLDIIKEMFERIHDTYEGIRVNAFIPCNCDRCKTQSSKNKYYFKDEFLKTAYQKNTPVQCQKSTEMVNIHGLVNDTFIAKNMRGWKRERTNVFSINKKEIRTLISENELAEVFDILLDELETSDWHNEVISLKSRWRNNKKQKRNGVISEEYFKLERNKINSALLELIDEL